MNNASWTIIGFTLAASAYLVNDHKERKIEQLHRPFDIVIGVTKDPRWIAFTDEKGRKGLARGGDPRLMLVFDECTRDLVVVKNWQYARPKDACPSGATIQANSLGVGPAS